MQLDRRLYSKYPTIKLIDKGFSNDTKYYLENVVGERFLLRVANISEFDRKKQEFEMLESISSLNINIPRATSFFSSTKLKQVYSIFTYVAGDDLSDKIASFSPLEQYRLGVEAGQILKIIHNMDNTAISNEWETKFLKKMTRKISDFKSCGVDFPNSHNIISFLEKNKHLLKNKKQCLHHGDYHIGNMVIDKDMNLGVVDFNRFDYGEPFEEFNRIVWCADESIYFASGRIDGYFDNEIAEDFFPLLALYIASNTLSSVVWGKNYGEKQLDVMLNQASDVLKWFDNFENTIPTWYVKCKKELGDDLDD